jgi:molybdate transport system regulatory protein
MLAGASPEAQATITLKGLLWMAVGDRNLGGPGRISLLRAIRDKGTITHAARGMGISYKAAWDAVDLMNRLAGGPLVVRTPGGRGGGSTRLTARGEALIERYDEAARLHRRFVETLDAESAGLQQAIVTYPGLARGATRQNRLPGRVASVRTTALGQVVELALPDGTRILGSARAGATDAAGGAEGGVGLQSLAPGGSAEAVFSTASVMLAVAERCEGLSARNRLQGLVERIVSSESGIEVLLGLSCGGSLAVAGSENDLHDLRLVAGARVTAVFKASEVEVSALPPS